MSDVKYRVTAIHTQNENSFTGDGGELVTLVEYELGLTNLSSGQEGIAVLVQKPETDAPAVGAELEGSVIPGGVKGGPNKGKAKFKKAYNGGGGGGYRGGGGRSPQEQASIRRQTAAKCAAEVLAGAVSSGKVTLDDALTKIESATGKFLHAIEADADNQQQQQTTTAQPVADVPADTGGLGTATAADDDIPF